MLESAIPEHLRQERTRQSSLPEAYEPPFPAYCARFPRHAKGLVMGIFGAQFGPNTTPSPSENCPAAAAALSQLRSFTATGSTCAPSFSEAAAETDARQYYNVAIFAYWPSKEAYSEWLSVSGFQEWWDSLDAAAQGHGWFREVFFPPIERFETVFSNNEVPEGAAHMRESVSGPMQEHVYWGSMRDRLPVSQTDGLIGEKQPAKDAAKDVTAASQQRIVVPGKKNLCVIRSGQDWHDTSPEERKLYTSTMHPVLTRGMNFLRDHGDETGCYSCRFMDVVDIKTAKADKDRTFGLAYFDDIVSLERWSKEHKTHQDIFGGFLQYAKKLDNNITLRLFHEVLVLEPEHQQFEYVRCHAGTGMLSG